MRRSESGFWAHRDINADDPHLQYLRVDGYRPMEGDLNMAGFDILNSTIDGYSLKNIFGDTKEPTGFADRTRASSQIAVDNGNRQFSISDTGSGFDFYIKGSRLTVVGTETVTFPNVGGLHHFYFDVDGVLRTTIDSSLTSSIILGDGVYVATITWDTSSQTCLMISDERHGLMDGKVHYHLHYSLGALWYNGGEVTVNCGGDGSSNSHAQIDIANIDYADEDIVFNVLNNAPQTISPIAQIPVFWVGADGYWRKKTADNFPFVYSGDSTGYIGSGGRIPYNKIISGAGSLLETSEDGYSLVYVVGTNDINTPIISILGRDQYFTLEDAERDAIISFLRIRKDANIPTKEMVGIGAFILNSKSSYSNTPKCTIYCPPSGGSYIDLRHATFVSGTSSSGGGGGGGGVTDHGQLTGLGDDDHTQYLLANGTRSLTGDLNLGSNDIINANTGTFFGNVSAASFNSVALTTAGSGTTFLANDGVYKSVVTSIFSRTGTVVATAGDYSASQITNNSTVTGTYVSNALDYLKGVIDGYGDDLALHIADTTNPHDVTWAQSLGSGNLSGGIGNNPTLQGTDYLTSSLGNTLTIKTQSGSSNADNVLIQSGIPSSGGVTGSISLLASPGATGTVSGGNVTITAAANSAGTGGNVTVTSGNGSVAGNLVLAAGTGSSGGTVSLSALTTMQITAPTSLALIIAGSSGTSGQILTSNGTNASWQNAPPSVTLPLNPSEDGYVAIASGGDLSYLRGSTDGDVLTWSETGNTWQSTTPKKSVTVEFALTEEVNNTTAYFFTWTGYSTGGLRSSSNTGLQNANGCSPYMVPFNATIKKAVLRVYGVGVQNGSVSYPVVYNTNLLRVNASSETKISDVDFSISNAFTVGTYSVGATNFTGNTTLSVDVDEGQMLGMQFENGSSASVAGQTRMAFITLVLEER